MKIRTGSELDKMRNDLKPLSDMMSERGVFKNENGMEYFSGYSYKYQYDWDLYFEGLLQVYMGWDATYLKNGVKLFLAHQREDGFIARSVPSNQEHDFEHVKPFLAQTAKLVYDNFGEIGWVFEDGCFGKLQKYLDYWLTEMNGSDYGLSDWMSGPHTGMDNQHERVGYWKDRVSKGVDLNCYLVLECEAFSQIARLASKDDLAGEYQQKAGRIRDLIQTQMWDPQDGFFYDLNAVVIAEMKKQGKDYSEVEFDEPPFLKNIPWGASINKGWGNNGDGMKSFRAGNPPWIKVKTLAGLMPLWAGVALPDQAERLVQEHLLNENEFWTPYPLAAMARDEPTYSESSYQMDTGCSWRGNVWIPTNYMICQGLRRYGYNSIAKKLAQRTTQLVQESGNREYYSAETGAGCGLDPFWGWSMLGHFAEYENENCVAGE